MQWKLTSKKRKTTSKIIGRQPPKNNERWPQKKMEDDLKQIKNGRPPQVEFKKNQP
jgi:hypothetical protein